MLELRQVRIAHPTRSIEAVRTFYSDLGLTEIAQFDMHEGFSGVVFGLPDARHQLEFTHQAGQELPTWSEETLLVFYVPSKEVYLQTVEALKSRPTTIVKSCNPYWERGGTTFLDPDGRRVVLFNSRGLT